ncbi:MAG: twitching motility protein PilU [Halieaceae bacterium]
MDVQKFLSVMGDKHASDGFITAGAPPSIKVHGSLVPIGSQALSSEQCREIVLGLMTESQREEFLQTHECNFALNSELGGRFRASAFFQRGNVGVVLRRLETKIPTVEQLNLPPITESLAMTNRGLIIFVGATGTGKSTSLAAMIGHRNRNSAGHIISVEDPVEFLHDHDRCIVTQREVGIDTASFEEALKNTLRQAPNVIVIGEVRTRDAMEQALTFAETGHLCLCTLHANNANQALDRILNFFPVERHAQVWMDLSLNLKAMLAQQLIRGTDGKSRRMAVEVLINTPRVADLIRGGEVHELKGVMKRSNELGMQTFDQSIFELYRQGTISYEDALSCADSANDLRLMIKLHDDGSDSLSHVPEGMALDLEAKKPENKGQLFK